MRLLLAGLRHRLSQFVVVVIVVVVAILPGLRRPPAPSPAMRTYIAGDLGGTNCRLVLVQVGSAGQAPPGFPL